jgi:hypothetical protein
MECPSSGSGERAFPLLATGRVHPDAIFIGTDIFGIESPDRLR